MEEFLIRPHHMLCLQFFEGKGYSDGFVENMAKVKRTLEGTNPVVTIRKGTDDICAGCPKNKEGRCIHEDSVLEHDNRVYQQVIDKVGNRSDWKTITEAVKKEIIASGKMKQVCGKCRWSQICFK